MREAIKALRWLNVGLANLLIFAHAGLFAYLAAAWSLADVLGPSAGTGAWLLLALVDVVGAVTSGAALGLLVWVLNRYALGGLEAAARRHWARRLGVTAFWVVVVAGITGAVELFLHRPVPSNGGLSFAVG